MKYFKLPDSRELNLVNIKLIKLYERSKELFKKDIVIKGFYGCPGSSILNGSIVNTELSNLKYAESNLKFFKEKDFCYDFTFNNSLIKLDMLEDIYTNILIRKAVEIYKEDCSKLSIICGNLITVDFFTKKDDIIRNGEEVSANSISTFYRDPIIFYNSDYLFDELLIDRWTDKSRNKVILPYGISIDRIKSIVNSFTNTYKTELLEVVVNYPKKEYLEDYYRECIYSNNYNLFFDSENFSLETVQHNFNKFETMNNEDINSCEKLGLNNFRILGRNNRELAVDSYSKFLIKERYSDLVKDYLLNCNEEEYDPNKFRCK